MDSNASEKKGEPRKFQFMVGEKIAYVEVISLTNYICAVEMPGQEPVFITKIRDKNYQLHWVSIPQGNEELAELIGKMVDEQTMK